DDRRSWKRVEFTHPPGHTRTFAFYFERPAVTDDHPELDPYGDDGPPWRIVSITPPGTAPPAETG
ncbi:MAG TPA: hypothetical protein VFF69_10090, partial [Phycisphaerales bacterium]|nr:hypothetical protein [Phycisphaerales bacterium]